MVLRPEIISVANSPLILSFLTMLNLSDLVTEMTYLEKNQNCCAVYLSQHETHFSKFKNWLSMPIFATYCKEKILLELFSFPRLLLSIFRQ